MLSLKRRFISQGFLSLSVILSLICIALSLRAEPPSQVSPTYPAWRTYCDKEYGFSLKYPPDYVILPETDRRVDGGPSVVHRVRFQDRKVLTWQTAHLEPPLFTVEVFKTSTLDLKEWLKSVEWIRPTDTVDSFHLKGAKEGYRVRNMIQLAPNEFYYASGNKYVYRLTPLGPHGPDMVASFRFESGR